MAYKLFNGDTWENASFAPTNIPVSNDQVVCPASVSGNKTDGSDNFNDVDLDLLYLHPGFRGDFGAEGAPLQGAADLIIHKGSGAFYFECTDSGAPNITTDEIRFECANSGVVSVIGTDSAATLGDFLRIVVNRGKVTLAGNIVFAGSAIVKVGSIDNVLGDVNLTIAASAPTLPDLDQAGGLTTLHNVVTNLRISACTCFKETAKAVNIEIFGGTLIYNHAASGSDVTLVEVHSGGTLDLMRNAVEKVIVKTIAHPGSTILYDPALHTINLTDLRTDAA